MGKKMYVGNLPRSVDQPTLEKRFGQFGTVESANLITDRVSGQCKGFGFVEMSSAEEAKAAIEHLNGTDFDGRPMTVNEARPQKKQAGFVGGQRFGRNGSGWHKDKH